jgi:uncharacterized protein (TIGR03086 family)
LDQLVVFHRVACHGFASVAERVPTDRWGAPSPCSEWDARAVVEHVIGFHEFLLLRPLGARAHRPRIDPAARWNATSDAVFETLEREGVLDRPTELPGGGHSSARAMLPALTTDVLVHTWDVAQAVGDAVALDSQLCAASYAAASSSGLERASGMFAAAVPVANDADDQTKLLAFYGRDPDWRRPHDFGRTRARPD